MKNASLSFRKQRRRQCALASQQYMVGDCLLDVPSKKAKWFWSIEESEYGGVLQTCERFDTIKRARIAMYVMNFTMASLFCYIYVINSYKHNIGRLDV
jgi:hypothetical protein